MRLSLCDCGVAYLVRLNRSFWMRFVPGRRHYFCVRCKTHQLLSRQGLRQAFPALPTQMDTSATAPAALEQLPTPSELFAASTRAPARERARTR
ncbi:MAG TPA: hypothetical protein VFM98_18700 [Ramlibacter sp.]|uniref:hypothetical protein n=1 Tax=Ramlibacter sp. TaxID=1917967 RepID=UPI002D80432C|nr:hypothetical protein [Ramlibacter sp.]HET8747635.1 hypothetical protein [Ramlibacter sp.]